MTPERFEAIIQWESKSLIKSDLAPLDPLISFDELKEALSELVKQRIVDRKEIKTLREQGTDLAKRMLEAKALLDVLRPKDTHILDILRAWESQEYER